MTSLPVLHQPVVLVTLCAVSDSQHSVIQSGLAAEKFVVHPTSVQLEARVTGVDSNGNGSDGSNGALKIWFTLALDVGKTGVCGPNIGGVESAFSVLEIKDSSFNVSSYMYGDNIKNLAMI